MHDLETLNIYLIFLTIWVDAPWMLTSLGTFLLLSTTLIDLHFPI